jgi:pyruvate dehydrogenase E2 component (dihydrolipoamide acetyltransferase)
MTIDFKFPDLGEGVADGEIKRWLVKEGDNVAQDQTIAEVETDKAVVEIPSPVAGTILKLNHKEGEMVKVGETLAIIGDAGELVRPVTPAVSAPEGRRESISVVGELPTEEIMVSSKGIAAASAEAKDITAVPAVRKLAKDLGVDLASLQGTGADGRITEEDVRGAGKGEKGSTGERRRISPKFDLYGWVDRMPIKGVRRSTARHMMESQAKVAAVTTMDQADVTTLVAMRERLKETVQQENGVKLTYMPFIVKAVVEALKAHPLLNSMIDDEAEQILLKKYYNIGVAVSIEEGLIVPVIKGADQKGIVELAEEIKKMADLAKERKLDLADLKGGTFTITNYGIFGATYGTPIINYPEVAILGTGRIMDMPLVVDGEIKVRKVLPLSLTFDHRAFDGAEAGRFMTDLKKFLEDPELLLLQSSSD